MPRNLIPQEPLDWRVMPRQEPLPRRSNRWDGMGDLITNVIVWIVTAALAVFAGLGIQAFFYPPKPQPLAMPRNVEDLKPGDTRDLGSGWTVTRTR